MSLSDAEALEQYRLARDKLTQAILDDESVVEIEVRNHRSRVTDPKGMLEFVEGEITRLEKKVGGKSSGRQRNSVATGKPR